jgi:hydrogenase maturation factor
MENKLENLNGLIRCTSYAFMPNRLHLCGPENQADILEFYAKINQPKKPKTIRPLLENFETLFPYLKLIASANRQKNPFAEEIIEAYWLGNHNLENVPVAKLYTHIINTIKLNKKISAKEFNNFNKKFSKTALPHHNFHVFSIWRRTGNIKTAHTLATMDACRISWGKVIKINPHSLIVKTKPLTVNNQGKIIESEKFIKREILNYFEGNILLKDIKIGDCVSLHWGCVCEKVNSQQVENLQKYTNLSLLFALSL